MASDGLYDRLYREAQARLAGILQGEERGIIRSYGAALLSIRKELKAIYDRYAADGKLTNGEMSKYNRLVTVQDRIEEILEEKLRQVDSLTRRLTGEQYKESFYRHAYAIDQAGGMALSWGQIPEDAVKAAVESGYSKLASSKAMARSRSGTVEKVRREIALSVIRGDSYDTLARRISDALGVRVAGRKAEYTDRGAAARSLTVARTEGQRVLAEGQAEATRRAAELGCEIETVWDATLDGRTRPAHGALDGRPKDDPEKGWDVPGIGWVSAPLHSGVASFDINCRCRMRDRIKGYPPEERYVRGDGIKPYQTYAEWKAEHWPDIHIGRSLSAAARNYPVLLPGGGHGKIAEGTDITDIRLIAGKGHKTPIRERFLLESDFKIPAEKWSKMTGNGFVVDRGIKRRAELHWYQADEDIVKMKVKRYIDEG